MDTLLTPADVEELAAKVHEDWMAAKTKLGVTSRPADDGEEQMVPYEQLSDRAKGFDRGAVMAVLGALEALGFTVAL